jgi:hypothetical protein
MCQADHKSYVAPTTKKSDRIHHTLRQLFEEEVDDNDEEDDIEVLPPLVAVAASRGGNTSTSTPEAAASPLPLITPATSRRPSVDLVDRRIAAATPPLRDLQRDIEPAPGNYFKEKYEETLFRLRDVEAKYTELLHRHQTYLLKTSNPIDLAVRAINLPFIDGQHFDGSDVLDDSEKKQGKKVRTFVTTIMGEGFFGGQVRQEIIKQTKVYIREEVYSPWKITRLMDKHGSKLSMESIDLLRTLETDGQKKYLPNTILCSSGSIKRVRKIIEGFAKTSIPYHLDALPPEHGQGEVISFDTKTVVKLSVGACGLKKDAEERRLCYPQSCDTTNITKNMSIMMYGFKIVDRAARCPVSKRPLWLHAAEGEQTQSLIQSCENSIPTKLVIGKETSEMVRWALTDNFKDMDEENNLTIDDHSIILGEGYKPLLCPVDADKKMHWCGLDSGGAAKVVDQPCPCCAITSDDLAVPNANWCSRFCNQWKAEGKLGGYPNWKCYHKPLITPARIAILREELDRLLEELGSLSENIDSFVKESKIDCSEDPTGQPQGNARSDPKSIFFAYGQATSAVRNAYMIALASDLSLRNFPTTGSLKEMQDRLKKALIKEYMLREVQKELDHGTVSEKTAMYLAINALPCILHLENRVGLKILTRLLRIGLGRAKAGLIDDLGSNQKDRIANFLKGVEKRLNTVIWGSEDFPVRWSCPYDDKEKNIGTICLDNERTRMAIDYLEELIVFCIPDMDDQIEWSLTIEFYRQAMIQLRKKEDLSDEEILAFQWDIDQYGQHWIDINMGAEGVTNYVHDLISGHIADYLFHWRNLYIHSQQGWEALNFAVKKYWFRCTNRGGGRGSKNRLIPLARWLQRRMVWMSSLPYDEIKRKVAAGEDFDIDAIDYSGDL